MFEESSERIKSVSCEVASHALSPGYAGEDWPDVGSGSPTAMAKANEPINRKNNSFFIARIVSLFIHKGF